MEVITDVLQSPPAAPFPSLASTPPAGFPMALPSSRLSFQTLAPDPLPPLQCPSHSQACVLPLAQMNLLSAGCPGEWGLQRLIHTKVLEIVNNLIYI